MSILLWVVPAARATGEVWTFSKPSRSIGALVADGEKSLDFSRPLRQFDRVTDILLPPRGQFLRDDAIRGGMDLLLFANIRHLKKADARLAALGLGRAHHRVLYFVSRRPELAVAELLSLLDITKQSLGRVTNELLRQGLMEQRQGERDRRQRLLRLTPAGVELERCIFSEMHTNVARAYAASGGEAVSGFWTVLQNLIGDEGRAQFKAVQGM